MLFVRTLFHNLSIFITFAATPLVLTPFVRNQGASAAVRGGQPKAITTNIMITSIIKICTVTIVIIVVIVIIVIIAMIYY